MACQWQAAMPSHDFKQNVMSKNITLLALKLYESITSLKDQNLDNNGPLFLTFIKMPGVNQARSACCGVNCSQVCIV